MFTDRQIQALQPKEKMYDVREGKGFTVRVLPSGTKTFYYVFKLKGKRYFYRIGTYDRKIGLTLSAARDKYYAAAQQVAKGINPIEEKMPSAGIIQAEEEFTVKKLIEDYLIHLEKSSAKSYVASARGTLNNDVLPFMGSRSPSDIRRRDAIELVEKVAFRAPAQGHGVLKFASAMFTYALHRERVEFNPFSGISAAVPAVVLSPRDRVLSDVEIKHVWRSLSKEDGIGTTHIRAALLLILVTAQRPGEVSGIAVSEVDGSWWTIPKERAKNKVETRVYLSPLALQLLPTTHCAWFFPNPALTSPTARNGLSHILSKKIMDENGNNIRPQYLGLPRWTPHDLRRTAATKLSELGCPDEIIDVILNHAKKGMIGVYNRNKYDKEKQEWLTKWAAYLEELVK